MILDISSIKSSYFTASGTFLWHQLQFNAPKRCLVHFYGTSCNSMPSNGMETHVHASFYHTIAPVDCHIDLLSFERLEMSKRACIWLYPLTSKQHGSRHIYLTVADTQLSQPLKSLLERIRWMGGSGARSKSIKIR